jgi:beta-D-xylosidase 4
MCTNRELVGGTLRRAFGFHGVVATDCGALNDAEVNHHRYGTAAETAGAAIKAGVDSNCGHVFSTALPAALGKNATLTEAELDVSIERLLFARFKLGLFDQGNPKAGVPSVGVADVDGDKHRAVALQAAREGVTLLQNGLPGKAMLPLKRSDAGIVAMIGPMANATMNLLSGYHGSPPFLVSPLAAMQAAFGPSSVTYAVGCNVSDRTADTPPSIAAAVAVAKQADTVIIGLGLCGDNYGGGPPKEDATCFTIDEAEGKDRWNLTLPGPDTVIMGSQMALFRAILALNKPTIVFVMSAGPVDISEIKASGVPIVAAGYGGEYGGQATVDVLTGAFNPGGALTLTTYPESFRHIASFRDMAMRPSPANGHAGRTYRFLDDSVVKPLWPFGWGLSYTTFALTFTQSPAKLVNKTADLEIVVSIKNTGATAGGIAVICYVAAVTQTTVPDAPRRSVFDFTRVPLLAPDAVHSATFTLDAESRGLWNSDGNRVYPSGTYTVQCEAGGVSATPVVRFDVS